MNKITKIISFTSILLINHVTYAADPVSKALVPPADFFAQMAQTNMAQTNAQMPTSLISPTSVMPSVSLPQTTMDKFANTYTLPTKITNSTDSLMVQSFLDLKSFISMLLERIAGLETLVQQLLAGSAGQNIPMDVVMPSNPTLNEEQQNRLAELQAAEDDGSITDDQIKELDALRGMPSIGENGDFVGFDPSQNAQMTPGFDPAALLGSGSPSNIAVQNLSSINTPQVFNPGDFPTSGDFPNRPVIDTTQMPSGFDPSQGVFA